MSTTVVTDLSLETFHSILLMAGPFPTARAAIALSVVARGRIKGRLLTECVARSLICTFSDEASCEYDGRQSWLYHVARLLPMGLLHHVPMGLLDTAYAPRVPPSWFLRAVFITQGVSGNFGFPIDLTVLRKMYAVFGMPYTDATHSKPAWLQFKTGRQLLVHSYDPRSKTFLMDLEMIMDMLTMHSLAFVTSYHEIYHPIGQHVSPRVFDAALSSWFAIAKGISPWLVNDSEEDSDGDADYEFDVSDSDSDSDSEYNSDSECVSDESGNEVDGQCMPAEFFDELARKGSPGCDPTKCYRPCRCTLIGPLNGSDSLRPRETTCRTVANKKPHSHFNRAACCRHGRRIGRVWDDDLMLAQFLSDPTYDKLKFFLE